MFPNSSLCCCCCCCCWPSDIVLFLSLHSSFFHVSRHPSFFHKSLSLCIPRSFTSLSLSVSLVLSQVSLYSIFHTFLSLISNFSTCSRYLLLLLFTSECVCVWRSPPKAPYLCPVLKGQCVDLFCHVTFFLFFLTQKTIFNVWLRGFISREDGTLFCKISQEPVCTRSR